MPNAYSPDSINAAFALAGAHALARRRQQEQLREHVDVWAPERESLASFIPAVFKTDTGDPAIPPAHLRRAIEVIQDDSLGDTVIVMPPGAAKTNTLIAACSWWLGQDPNQHIGYFSNTDRQAYRRSVAVRDTVNRSLAYRSIFPELEPDFRKGWAEYEWFLKREDVADKDASFMAAGVGSAIQGSRLDRAVLDDIADKKNMATALQREKVIEWLRDQVMSRMAPVNRKVMLCTRWHAQDPAAWAMAQGWRLVHLPALDEDGESYWPGRWPLEKLACPNDEHGRADDDWEPTVEQPRPPCWVERDPETGQILRQGNCQKLIFGSRAFQLTFQGIATPDEGTLFPRSRWRRYSRMPSTRGGGIFIDTATSDKTTGDFFAMATWRTTGLDFFVENVLNEHLAFPDQVNAVMDAWVRSKRSDDEPPLPVYIEEVAWALPLITTLQTMIPGVVGVKPGGHSKYARAMAATPFIESGNVYLPEQARWVADFIEEHVNFTGEEGGVDNQVDTTSLALHVLGAKAMPPAKLQREEVRYGRKLPPANTLEEQMRRERAERQRERPIQEQRRVQPGRSPRGGI